jgi:ATP-dependent DNA helicase RecG
MDEMAIEQRLRLGEDSVTEFKGVARTNYLANADDLAKAIVAFANSGGGTIFLGVEDDGTPTGVGTLPQADALMRQVSQICRDAIQPAIGCLTTKVEYRGTQLLIIAVPAFAPDRPYFAHHRLYVRDANRSRDATRDELFRLIQSVDYHFDEQTVEGASREDLDPEAVAAFMKGVYGEAVTGEHADRYLKQLLCIDGAGRPTVAGLLLFGAEPCRWLRDARISAVRFPGCAVGGEMSDHKEITSWLPRQIDEALDFLKRNVPAPARVGDLKRDEIGIPLRALREAILNAVTHRDYRMSSQVILFVFDDRVEITNPGGLLNRLTLDSIRLGATQRRNGRISDLMHRLERHENGDRGIPEMIHLMKERSLPEPEFDLQGGHFRAILRARPAGAPA